jgi:hypothetical protein
VKKTMTMLAVGLVIVGWNHDGARALAASQARSSTSPSQSTWSELGGYQPVSDVRQHARMSVDVCAVNALLDAKPIDFAAIRIIYRDGRHSPESNGSLRAFGKFARAPRSSEYLLSRYEKHLGPGWIDAFATAAIDGTGAFAGEADLVRRQGVQKAVRDQVLVAWAFHELDAAVDKASKGDFATETGAPHNWDEVRAYYHGEKPECAPVATADERGREFGTGGAVNARILAALQEGLRALQAKNGAGAATARDEVVRNITITYIQSAIKYSAMLDAAVGGGKLGDARIYQAEGWAYFRVIEPLIAEVTPEVARTVAGIFSLSSPPAQGSGDKVARALAEVYNALKIRPAEVGQYGPS